MESVEGLGASLLDDDDVLMEVLILACLELGLDDGEVPTWITTVADIPEMQTVAGIKQIMNTPTWEEIQLPQSIKGKIKKMLTPFEINGVDLSKSSKSRTADSLTHKPNISIEEEEEEDNTLIFRRERRATVISPEVMAILSEEEKLDLEEEGIGEDLAEQIREMNMEIKKVDKGMIQELQLFIKGIGESTLNLEELDWTVSVLDAQIRHAMGIARLYLCKQGDIQWQYSELLGVAAIVTESNLKNNTAHFLRLVDLNGDNPNKSLILNQEIYPGMEYHKDSRFFHSFEVDGYMAGFSFASEDEADLFYDKVQYCLKVSAFNVYDDFLDKREQSTINVGDNFVTTKPEDGKKLNWSKPAPDGELAKELEAANPELLLQKKSVKVIDLISSPQPQIPEDIVKFKAGKSNIQDGIQIKWKKNSRALASESKSGPKTQEELEEELESRKHRCKRLNELRKNALQGKSDRENKTVIHNLKLQIDEEKRAIKSLEENLGKIRKNRFTKIFKK